MGSSIKYTVVSGKILVGDYIICSVSQELVVCERTGEDTPISQNKVLKIGLDKKYMPISTKNLYGHELCRVVWDLSNVCESEVSQQSLFSNKNGYKNYFHNFLMQYPSEQYPTPYKTSQWFLFCKNIS